jgi:alpha-methylacyl-CoA racemase
MERLGRGPAAERGRHPRLVDARMTGWGQSGPMADRAGHDIDYIALSGALGAIGRAGGAPVPPVNLLGDYAGGTMFALAGTLGALYERARSGMGQVVDAAMLDGAAALTTPLFALMAAGIWRDQRGVNLLDTGAPFYDVYQTRDGKYLGVGPLEDPFFAQLIERLGLPPDAARRRLDRAEWAGLRAEIAAVLATRTRDEWVEVFDGSDACVAPVLDFAEARNDPHNRARNLFVTDDRGTVQPAPAPRFGRTPSRVPSAPPTSPVAIEDVIAAWRA